MEQQLPLFARELAPADQQTVRKALSLLECQLRETGASFTSSHAVRDWLRLQLASLEREELISACWTTWLSAAWRSPRLQIVAGCSTTGE